MNSQRSALERCSAIRLPCLLLYVFERNELYKYTQQYLTQQWSEHLARDQACSWSLPAQSWICTSPSHCGAISRSVAIVDSSMTY